MLKAAEVNLNTLSVDTEPDSWSQHYFSEHEDYENTYESATQEEKKT